MNTHKAYGPFSISADLLKLIMFEISQPLADLISLSLETGVHAEVVKT